MADVNSPDAVFREFEKILDKHHEGLELWSRERPTAVYAALAQFDCMSVISLMMVPDLERVGTVQALKRLEEGLSEALRWLHPGVDQFDLVPSSDCDLLQQATKYCRFAGKYVDIADFHKMYGRGQVGIEIDALEKRIRFVPLEGVETGATLLGISEQSHRMRKLIVPEAVPHLEELGQSVRDLLDEMECEYDSGHVTLVDISVVNHDLLKRQYEMFVPNEPFVPDPDVDLIGFSAGEFENYFSALRRWSFCCTHGFMRGLANRKSQWECAPTQCIARDDFLESMEILTGLQPSAIQAITNRLTYDARTKRPDVFQQPLFCGPKYVAWSTSVVENSKHMRNMLKLMSRSPKYQDAAATIIGDREGPMLWELGDNLSRRGRSSYKLMTEVEHGGQQGEIDLLSYNAKHPSELLVVEGKALLGVDEIGEVGAATKEMQAGQGQLEKVIGLLASMPNEKKHELFKFVPWERVEKVFGVVVSADVDPNEMYDHSRFPGISLQTILDRLKDNRFASPEKFWQACRDRHWLKDRKNYKSVYGPVKVGELTYELPGFVEPEETPSGHFG